MELRDVMTPNPTVCRPEATARDAAALMRDQDIGDVLVQDNGGPLGIVTDRDIVTRAVAAGRDPENVHLGEIGRRCSVTSALPRRTTEVAPRSLTTRTGGMR
jgi:CBS domain-containing protein